MTNKILSKSGFWLLRIFTFLPALIWVLSVPLSEKFSDIFSTTRSLGDLLGLTGMAMFALTLILSARLKIFEKVFNGMNEVYSAHHNLGAFSLCLLLFHPLLLAYGYLMVSYRDAALFLLPSADNWAVNYGIFSLFLMIFPLLITFYIKLRYQIWKFTHKFLGLAFIFAFLHTITIGADISKNAYLRYYLVALSFIAIILYFYRTVLGKYFVKKYKYSVKSITENKDKIWEIEFEPIGEKIKYLAGQFVFLKIINSNLNKEFHPFSISSSPEENLKIAIKELGDYTNKIGLVKTADMAEIEGPYGSFNFQKFAKKQLWIAGGVGITPFLGMLYVLSKTDNDFKVDLYYSVKDESCLAFKEKIEEAARNNKNLKINFWDTEKNGFINVDKIIQSVSDIRDRDILICGPTPMMQSLKTQLLAKGVKKINIHTDEFQLY